MAKNDTQTLIGLKSFKVSKTQNRPFSRFSQNTQPAPAQLGWRYEYYVSGGLGVAVRAYDVED